MLRRISIAEVQHVGVNLKPEEAIAIAQQLIHAPSSAPHHAPDRPLGPPTAASVYLAGDGTVSCGSCDVTLAVSEIARFLQQILPPETTRISGSLRYTIARALLEVDAQPFDSLTEFSDALARHERGERAARVTGVLHRAMSAMSRGAADAPAVDCRRVSPEISELRRQLRESDARLYDQQLALDAVRAVRRPAKPARHVAVAAGLAIGLTMMGAGQLMRPSGASSTAEPRAAAVDSTVEGRSTAAVRGDIRTEGLSTPSGPEQDRATTGRRPSRHPSNLPSPRVAKVNQSSRPGQRSSPSLLDRLHLGWLKKNIVIRDDL